MKIKVLIAVLVFIIIFYLTYTYATLAQTAPGKNSIQRNDKSAVPQSEPTVNQYMDTESDTEDDDFFIFEQDFFLRKLSQRKLRDLTAKEKIIWAFRLAGTHSFL